MSKTRVPLRIDAELAAWVDVYAGERGVSRTAVYEAALESFRALSKGGVPELESALGPAGEGQGGADRGGGATVAASVDPAERPHRTTPASTRAPDLVRAAGAAMAASVLPPTVDLRAKYAGERQARLNAAKERASGRGGNG